MGTQEKLAHAAATGQLLVRRPSEVRNVRRWLSNLRVPTIESGLPWLPFIVIDHLEGLVNRDTQVFEFGGGGSTLWFSQRAGAVKTVEHDRAWFDLLDASTQSMSNSHVTWLAGEDLADYVSSVEIGGPWDVIVVDGRERVRCFERAMQNIKPGGVVILDDSDRPRYAPAHEMAHSWPSVTFSGLAPYKPFPAISTLWTRPA